MKRFFAMILVFLAALSICVSANSAEAPQILLLEDSSRRLMLLSPETGLLTLTEQYVLDYHYDTATETVWYTAMEDGQPVLCSVNLSGSKPVYYSIIEDEETLKSRVEPMISLLSSAPNRTVAQMVQAAMQIIFSKEGNYGSVNADDHGAVSIGKVQWHATRALNLMKTIVLADEVQARAILGDALCDEILTSDSWSSRTVNAEEKIAISTLLKTEVGKAAQDALAEKDISDYIYYGMNKGLESSLALVYFADLQNHWGSYGAYKQLQKAAGENPVNLVTLDMLHNACLDYTTKYHARRTSVYNYCLGLGWQEFTDSLSTPQNAKVSSTGYTANISWDEVDDASHYTCRILEATEGYPQVGEPLQTEDPFCTVALDHSGIYFVEITAWAGYVQSEASLWTPLTVLSTPSIEEVSLSGRQAIVKWETIPNAASYTCRIIDEFGAAVCTPIETIDSSCTVKLELGKRYSALVIATNSDSCSEESDAYAFCTVGIPGDVSADARKGNVTVSWAAAANAQSYQVELLQEDQVLYCSTTNKTTYTFTGVPNGSYFTRVTAHSALEGIYSKEYSFTVEDTDPDGLLHGEAIVQKQKDQCTVHVTLFYAKHPSLVLVAGYKNRQMVSVCLAQSDPGGTLFLLDGDPDEVRVLTLDNLTEMKPQCSALIIPQSDFIEYLF